MAANTKYTAAPQRDSFDDTAMYSQAPPSYADEPSASADQAALLGGAPRSSEDNIPDDFKVSCRATVDAHVLELRSDALQFGGNVSEGTIDIRMAFVRKVYAIL
jgi:hypothetical protein